mmetsp:Transcript_7794/g.21298  ORF Transcript_7794/g.21298 Transcript_7794/m.21298 type:complete len:87 (-) Transcript_7794:251-511(-)
MTSAVDCSSNDLVGTRVSVRHWVSLQDDWRALESEPRPHWILHGLGQKGRTCLRPGSQSALCQVGQVLTLGQALWIAHCPLKFSLL